MSAGDYKRLPTEDLLYAGMPPPAYGPSDLPTSSVPASTSQLPGPISNGGPGVATNYLSIINDHSDVTGTYTIDTSAPEFPRIREVLSSSQNHSTPSSTSTNPAFIDDWLKKVQKILSGPLTPKQKLNAFFSTSNGKVDVTLKVKGGGIAVIGVDNTKYGSEGSTLAISERDPSTRLDIVITDSTKINVALPKDFCGVVSGGTNRGKLTFSPALAVRTITYTVNQQNPAEGRYFIRRSNELEGDVAPENEGQDSLQVIAEGYSSRDILIQTWEEHSAAIEEQRILRNTRKTGFEGWIERVGRQLGVVCTDTGSLIATCFGA